MWLNLRICISITFHIFNTHAPHPNTHMHTLVPTFSGCNDRLWNVGFNHMDIVIVFYRYICHISVRFIKTEVFATTSKETNNWSCWKLLNEEPKSFEKFSSKDTGGTCYDWSASSKYHSSNKLLCLQMVFR